MDTDNRKKDEVIPVDEYPGVAIDSGDDNKVTDSLEKQYTCLLNDNPNSAKTFND